MNDPEPSHWLAPEIRAGRVEFKGQTFSIEVTINWAHVAYLMAWRVARSKRGRSVLANGVITARRIQETHDAPGD